MERDAKRQQRKAIDALRSRIKHLEPPVAIGDTWEQVRPRVERYEEYKLVNSDDDRQVAFDKHMNRLKEDAAERERVRRHDRERDRARDERHTSRRDRDRRRSRTPNREDAYEADRRRAATERERQYRHSSAGGLSPPPRERRDRSDRYVRDDRDRSERQVSLSVYDRERREREAERERSYISRADPRAKASELDYGDSSDAPSRPESVSGKRASGEQDSRRQAKVRLLSLTFYMRATQLKTSNRDPVLIVVSAHPLAMVDPLLQHSLQQIRRHSRKKSLSSQEARRARSRRSKVTRQAGLKTPERNFLHTIAARYVCIYLNALALSL